MPLPPPPANELALFAHTIAGAMRRGMNGKTFAWFMRMRLGIDYVRKGASYTPDQVLEQFRGDPVAWAAIEPMEPRFAQFWKDAIVKFQEMIAKEDAPK